MNRLSCLKVGGGKRCTSYNNDISVGYDSRYDVSIIFRELFCSEGDTEGEFVSIAGYSISAETICAGDGDINGLSLRVAGLIYAPL